MEYLVPPGKEAPAVEVRDVTKDTEDAKLWIKENIKDVIEVHEARKIVQEAFPSLVNDEAFAVVMEVRDEWTPKEVAKDTPLVEKPEL